MGYMNTVEKYGDGALIAMILERSVTEYVDDAIAVINTYSFGSCSKLTLVDIPNATAIRSNAFIQSAVDKLILRNSSMTSLDATIALKGTPIASGTGYIYVPRALIDSYKAATNWATYADQFRALEDYTVDGTTTGDLDETKI